MARAAIFWNFSLIAVSLLVRGTLGKKETVQASAPGLLADGTWDWDEILRAGRAGVLDTNTNGDALPGSKASSSKKAIKKGDVKAPSAEELTKQWHRRSHKLRELSESIGEVLEQAKREASLAGAPAPGATLPEQIAPNTAPSGHPAPANMHNIKLASAHEGASVADTASEAGYKAREGYKPVSWLQKSHAKP